MRQFARAEIACRNSEPLQRLHLMALQCGSDHVSDQWKKQLPLARDPEHKTLGIIGLGGIGQVVARRMALGWNTTVIIAGHLHPCQMVITPNTRLQWRSCWPKQISSRYTFL
jgi:lactate dehydrogenase-like 2-hydroxyacid dehydrogenase